ncbi:hypothetical protein E4U41_005414 [Claviceps citrina]|nr:hypothetical protein E4U41_005414 [Claviceps citrina]
MRTPSTRHAWSFRTAPNTPGSRSWRTGMPSRQSSRDNNGFTQAQAQAQAPQRPRSSFCSSKATITTTGSSSESGSVIRLATTADDPDGLPYVLSLRRTL